MKSKGQQPRLLYSAKLSFKIEGEIRGPPNKKKLKEFVNTQPVLQQLALRRRKRKKAKQNKTEEHILTIMALHTYLSKITLNVNCLNAPTKRHKVAEWVRK